MGELLVPLWRGTFSSEKSDNVHTWPWAVLQGEIWKEHGKAVASCQPYIPGSFGWPPRNIADKVKSGYKAKEWQGYFYDLCPALLYNILPHAYWKNFCRLVHGVWLILQRKLTINQVYEAQQHFELFHLEFEILYMQ